MKVLIFEHAPHVSGHRLPYASLVAKAFDPSEVIVAVPRCLENEKAIDDYFGGIRVEFYDTAIPASPLLYAWNSYRCLQKAIVRFRPDHVCVPTADGMAVLAGLLRMLSGFRRVPVPIDIALMIGRRPPAELSWKSRMANQCKWRLIRHGSWKHILLMDPRTYCEVSDQDRVRLSPEPVPPPPCRDRQHARTQLGVDPKGRLIVSPGNQNLRKGSDLLIDAFLDADLCEDDRLLLIGRFTETIQSLLEKRKGHPRAERIICQDRFVAESEFACSIVAADLVAVPYRDTLRPSGVISRCVAWGVPIWGSNSGWPRWAIEQFKAGYTVDSIDSESSARSLALALHQSAGFQRSAEAESFAAENTVDNFQAMWRNLVRCSSAGIMESGH